MSLKKYPEISLMGLGKVVYPDFLTLLQTAWDSNVHGGFEIQKAIQNMANINLKNSEDKCLKTSDNYQWYAELTYQPNETSKLIFLLPFKKDTAKEDNSLSDRAIGVIEVGDGNLIDKVTKDPKIIYQICKVFT